MRPPRHWNDGDRPSSWKHAPGQLTEDMLSFAASSNLFSQEDPQSHSNHERGSFLWFSDSQGSNMDSQRVVERTRPTVPHAIHMVISKFGLDVQPIEAGLSSTFFLNRPH